MTPLARDQSGSNERRPRQPTRELCRASEAGQDANADQRLVRPAQRVGGPQHQPPRGQLRIERRKMRLRKETWKGQQRGHRDCRSNDPERRPDVKCDHTAGDAEDGDRSQPRGRELLEHTAQQSFGDCDWDHGEGWMSFFKREELPVIVDRPGGEGVQATLGTA